MNLGLFAMLAGFLLPLALTIRLGWMVVTELHRGQGHPLVLVLTTELSLAMVPVIALAPSAWLVVTGRSIEDGAMLLDFTATNWGLAKLAVNILGVLLADAAMPRVYDQLVREPASALMPTQAYLARDIGILLACLALAFAAAHS